MVHGLLCTASRLRQRGAMLRETLPMPPDPGCASSSSFTSLHQPPISAGGIRRWFAAAARQQRFRIGQVGCSAQRSKEGGVSRRLTTDDMSGVEHPACPIPPPPRQMKMFHRVSQCSGQPSLAFNDRNTFPPSRRIGNDAAQPSSGATAIPVSSAMLQLCSGQATLRP